MVPFKPQRHCALVVICIVVALGSTLCKEDETSRSRIATEGKEDVGRSTEGLLAQLQQTLHRLDSGEQPNPNAGVHELKAKGFQLCGDVLQVARVALLFLSYDSLPLGTLWDSWLRQASGLIPVSAAEPFCSGAGGNSDGTGSGSASDADPTAGEEAGGNKASGSWISQSSGNGSGEGEGGGGSKGRAQVERRRQLQLGARARRQEHLSSNALQKAAGLCSRLVSHLVQEEGKPAASHGWLLQALFSVYLHVDPRGRPPGDGEPFASCVIPGRIEVARVHHSMIEAERLLLRAALADPANQRFALLSDTSVPLYSPGQTYLQMMAETARQNPCTFARRDVSRWTSRMTIPGKLHRRHWRKSSQWFTLNRELAQVIADEEEINAVFAQHCTHRREIEGTMQVAFCVSDEHYIPTVLAALGLGKNTTCVEGSHYIDWQRVDRDGRPHTFGLEELDDDGKMLRKARANNCDASNITASMRSAVASFVNISSLAAEEGGGCTAVAPLLPHSYPQLRPHCALFFRKVHRGATGLAGVFKQVWDHARRRSRA